jgi:acetylornithine/N-succinyldiaminopimelate aminotransferase
MNIIKSYEQHILPTYARQPVVIEKGEGSTLWTPGGVKYIDFTSGIGVNSFGACDGEIIKAVTEQLGKIQHTSNYFHTKPVVELAEMLCEKTGADKVFFSNSGAEANECAIKAARKYSQTKYGGERFTIVTLRGSFHGRTMATVSATGQADFHKYFSPFLEGFVYVTPGDIESVIDRVGVCAVMLEVVQGEGGVHNIDLEYLSVLSQYLAERDILLIIDEVQTGNGRCGSLYAYMQAGITPDIITTAKGLAGGLPIGATLFWEKCSSALGKGDHGSTFGGNPVTAAAALSVLSRLDDAFLADVNRKSEIIREELKTCPGVESLSGLGLMVGIKTKANAAQILEGCREKGLLVLTAKDKVRLLPPLNISDKELHEGLNILKEVIKNETSA